MMPSVKCMHSHLLHKKLARILLKQQHDGSNILHNSYLISTLVRIGHTIHSPLNQNLLLPLHAGITTAIIIILFSGNSVIEEKNVHIQGLCLILSLTSTTSMTSI